MQRMESLRFKCSKQHQPRTHRPIIKLVMALTGLLYALSAVATYPPTDSKPASSQKSIGTITLALGKSIIEKPDGKQRKAASNDQLYPGDTLITFSSGYLHLRFVDNALLSMRPESTLSIDTYNYDPDSPEKSAVRFNLKEGMARSVSGSAAKQDHQKFRLNTPLAAIGVRGTDFTVLADDERVRTFVSEGAIVVSPFSNECQSLSLGPCAKGGVELKGNSNLLVELDAVSARPQLLKVGLESQPTSSLLMNDTLIAQLNRSPDQRALDPGEDLQQNTRIASSEKTTSQDEASPKHPDTLTVSAITAETAETAGEQGADNTLLSMNTEQSDSSLKDGNLLIASRNDTGAELGNLNTEGESVAVQFGSNNEIGTDIIPKELEGITVPEGVLWSFTPPKAPGRFLAPDFIYTEAQIAAGIDSGTIDKHKIFANEQFAFYRPNELYDTINPIRPNQGSVGFQLQQAAAFYYAKGEQFNLNFNSGKLLIDFENGKFSTALQMSHKETGQISFSSSGDVTPEGLFSRQQADHSISGAVSLDTKEAGYYFEQSIPHLESQINGVTTWQSTE